MAYQALLNMREQNRARYGIEETVYIPPLPETRRSYGREALAFLRDCCEDLKFDTADPLRAALADSDGNSVGPGQIPYNMERDLDRLCLETAVARFLASGSREDAFDVYYCYCEIFRPFGEGYESTGLLIELLSEHETNASSLLTSHRDHYSHSVYEFLIGLAIYKNVPAVREAYNRRYGLAEGKEAACHFLEYWGLTALFHDIGYPFEIAHQQMKAYVCALDKDNNDDYGFAPYVSYRNMDDFALSRVGDLNELFAGAIIERLSGGYLERTGMEAYYARYKLTKALRDRAIHENPREKDYLYMDHAYFSGLMLAKAYLGRHPEIHAGEDIPREVMDALCAVILHNSLFKFTLRGLLHTRDSLRLGDGQPLAYLLMLCDELQCWDRASYGQNTRGGIFAFDFDMDFSGGGMRWTYFYDKTYEEKVLTARAYKNMRAEGYTKKSGAVRVGRSKFVDDIDEIIALRDVLPGFEPDVKKPDPSGCIGVRIEEKTKKTGLHLSDDSYLSLYEFACATHARHSDARTPEEMRRYFDKGRSLEYKLSSIAQAKAYAGHLAAIGCFYTDRAVDYEPVTSFAALIQKPGHENDLEIISRHEHDRWWNEKITMGWKPGTKHMGALTLPDGSKRDDKVMRERTRLHHDLVDYGTLEAEEQRKDTEPMEKLLELLREYDGLTVYRLG